MKTFLTRFIERKHKALRADDKVAYRDGYVIDTKCKSLQANHRLTEDAIAYIQQASREWEQTKLVVDAELQALKSSQ